MADFNGKVAIVTGAGGGIGSATATILAERGAKVALADIRLDGAEKYAARLKDALAVHLDLGDEDSIIAMIEATKARFGRIDILCNLAADLNPQLYTRDRDIETMEAEVWDRTFRINLRGTMLACKYALPAMRAAGGGAIVNVASNLGMQGAPVQAAYAASKAAIIQMTRSIATSHGRDGIRANTVSPGLTLSPSVRAGLPKPVQTIIENDTLTPYLGEPRDIAHAIVFLCSDEARYITGHNLVADGGTYAHYPSYAPMRALLAKEKGG